MINVISLVQEQESFFNNAISDTKIEWRKESQFAIQAFTNNNHLAETARKSPASAQNAIINVAAIGISLNPAKKHAYLVPRGGNVCLDISYQGLMHIAMQTGSIAWGQSKIVYENDKYENNGIDKAPNHVQDTFGNKGNIIGAYCTVKTVDGDYLTEEMDINQINDIRSRSKAKSGPWVTDFAEMARKTVVKRASKYWPKVDRLDNAIDVINQHEGIDFNDIQDVTIKPDLISDDDCFNLLEKLNMGNIPKERFLSVARISSLHLLEKSRLEGSLKWIDENSEKEVIKDDNS